jgi:predicted membrane protein
MLDFSVSLWPLLVVAVANFILSWIYYSPAVPWFKAWQVAVGMDPNKKEMTEEDKKAMPGLMFGALVATFLLSYGLQVVIHSLKATDFVSGLVIGVVAWLVFAVTQGLNARFEGKKFVLFIINSVWYLITYAGFGGLVAVWH